MNNGELSLDELDALREAVSIGSGAAATAVSGILDADTRITAPQITVCRAGDLPLEELEPVFGVEIEYIEGLEGKNLLLLRQGDVQGIVRRMTGTPVEDGFVLDEMAESCVREFMNQMMGASATALAEILQRATNITTPRSFEVQDLESLRQTYFGHADAAVAAVRLVITVEGVLDGTFFQIMPLPFAKTLAGALLYGPDAWPEGDTAPCGTEDVEPEAGVEPTMDTETSAVSQKAGQIAPAPPTAPVSVDIPPTVPPAADGARLRPAPAAWRESAPPYHVPGAAEPQNLNMLLDVQLKATVELGRARRKVSDVLSYGEGDLIVLERGAGEPVDLFVGGVLVAKGTIVVVDGDFGFRVDKIYARPWLRRNSSAGICPV